MAKPSGTASATVAKVNKTGMILWRGLSLISGKRLGGPDGVVFTCRLAALRFGSSIGHGQLSVQR